jgi:uncharacterized protein YkwD
LPKGQFVNNRAASTVIRSTGASRRFGAGLRVVIGAVAFVLATLAMPVSRASADVTFNARMLELVNRDRAANGLSPVVADPTLAATAEDAPYLGCGFPVAGRAADMGQRNYFSHTILGCGTQSIFNILNSITGLVYSGAGENIAWLSATTDPLVAAENLHGQLMDSPGHRANILNPNFTKVGIGSWHTETGQSWSGGGTPLTRVYIGVEVFAGGPVATPPPTGSRYHPLSPSRILDTRVGNGAPAAAVAPGATLNLQVGGRGGVPATGVSAVVLNVTATQPTAASYLTVYPSGDALPNASNLNVTAGQTAPNLVVAKVGTNGQVSVFNANGFTHVIADVAGWYDLG